MTATSVDCSRHYSKDSITAKTALLQRQHYSKDSITAKTALQQRQHYNNNRRHRFKLCRSAADFTRNNIFKYQLRGIKQNKIHILMDRVRGWITKEHQKLKKTCKFITIILFGTTSESFRKIVRRVFELRALLWGWGWEWQCYGT